MDQRFRELLKHAARIVLIVFLAYMAFNVISAFALERITGQDVVSAYKHAMREGSDKWGDYQPRYNYMDGTYVGADSIAATVRNNQDGVISSGLASGLHQALNIALVFIIIGLLRAASRDLLQNELRAKWLFSGLISLAIFPLGFFDLGWAGFHTVIVLVLVLMNFAYSAAPLIAQRWTVHAVAAIAAIWMVAISGIPQSPTGFMLREMISRPVYQTLWTLNLYVPLVAILYYHYKFVAWLDDRHQGAA